MGNRLWKGEVRSQRKETSTVHGVRMSAELEALFLIALSSTSGKAVLVLFHKTSLGQRSYFYLSRKRSLENFFFLKTIAM